MQGTHNMSGPRIEPRTTACHVDVLNIPQAVCRANVPNSNEMPMIRSSR